MRIRFRTDSSTKAEDAARLARGEDMLWHTRRRELGKTPAAEPGDCWRVRWHGHPDSVAGYAICCPKCNAVHRWTQAARCAPANESSCQHAKEHRSCWTWTGSAEDGTLNAQPSLNCASDLGGCGWHGNLTKGELSGA